MKLTPAQIDYISKRNNEIEKILSYSPEKGKWSLMLEQQWLAILLRLHNITVKEEKNASTTNSPTV
jgi:hypothetical protein